MTDARRKDDGRTVIGETKPMSDDEVLDAWFRGVAKRAKGDPSTKSAVAIASALDAYFKFEKRKLRVALSNADYNYQKHRNDAFDAEQLIYLFDPSLVFLTCDTGFNKLLNNSKEKSTQSGQIRVIAQEDLDSAAKVESLLRGLTL